MCNAVFSSAFIKKLGLSPDVTFFKTILIHNPNVIKLV